MVAKKILIIDDDLDICQLLARFFTKNGFLTACANSGQSAMQLFNQEKFDLVFCDFRLGDFDGRQMIEKIKAISPATKIIIITGYSDVRMAVEVIKSGASDYITKPLIPDEILRMANAVLSQNEQEQATSLKANSNGHVQSNGELATALNKQQPSKYILGNSIQSKQLYAQVDLVAPTQYSVIIYGESGTGKEAISKRIHDKSKRYQQPFVAVDCGSLSKELAASELFGHIKGSFTGAIADKIGHFEAANGGTIFLDEVANLSYEVQVLLLRVIQERTLRRIGSNKEIEIDVRIVIASNERLNLAVASGKFREDLYHRFNEFVIEIPPLRERNKDIMLFANHFLQLANAELGKEIQQFSTEVKTLFTSYAWPGNLREMNNVVKRAVLLTDTDVIELHVFPAEIIYPEKFLFQDKAYATSSTKMQKPIQNDLKSNTQNTEYQVILEVLQKVKYNRSKASVILGIDRKTLYLKMKALDMLES